ncbi:hypothetical protein BGX28_000838 [Mortierella sp. GBA30]|nr:hypothetical protein BGX28_000838 [Mortierella sp. GBA30]
MFCPRLDSALVASIYSDMGDFKACIPILSALAAAAPGGKENTPKTTADSTGSTTMNTTTGNNDNKLNNKKNANTTTTSIASSSNERNILIWSEGVANSNASGKPTTRLLKQGQVVPCSSTSHPSTSLERPSSSKATPSSTLSPRKTTFKAVRNPNYMRKSAITEEIIAPAPGEEVADDDYYDDNTKVEDDIGDDIMEEGAHSSQMQQDAKKAKKNRRQKRATKTETAMAPISFSSSSAAMAPRRTWKKDENGQHTPETELSDRLFGLSVSDMQTADADVDADARSEDEAIAQILEYEANEEHQSANSTDNRGDRDGIKAEELQFLKSCFPDREHSVDYLVQILKSCKRDLEAAVELILSEMFLESEQFETSSSGSGSLLSSTSSQTPSTSTTVSSLDDSFFQGAQKAKKKMKAGGSGGGGGIEGSGTSAWGSRQHHKQVWDEQNDDLLNTIDRQDEFLIPESNEWATFEHQISILMNIFHTVPQKIIVSEYHANGTNLFKTVDSLEKRLKLENHDRSAQGRERQSQFDMNLAQLVELFPDHSAAGLKRMLVYNGGNLQDAMNAVLAADIVRTEQKGIPSSSSSTKRGVITIPFQAEMRFADKNAVPNPSSSGNRLKSLPSTNNPFPGGPRPFPNTILDHANSELYNDEDNPIWCRQRAHETLEQRNELFRKAARAYKEAKNKGAGMGGIAAYYADEGKKLDAQGKQWHMRAARAVVQQHRIENNDPNLVDLHGLTITEAQTVVKEAVTQWFSRATMQANRIAAKPLRIVCGVGSHSKDRVARLYPTILSLLMKDGWRCEAENGVIVVKGVSRIMPSTSKKR